MSHASSIYYVMNCGDNTYYRFVKKASDPNEKSFRVAAMETEAKKQKTTTDKLHSGKVQQKTSEPTNGIEI